MLQMVKGKFESNNNSGSSDVDGDDNAAAIKPWLHIQNLP